MKTFQLFFNTGAGAIEETVIAEQYAVDGYTLRLFVEDEVVYLAALHNLLFMRVRAHESE